MVDALKNNLPCRSKCYEIIIPFMESYCTIIEKLAFETEPDYEKIILMFEDCLVGLADMQEGKK